MPRHDYDDLLRAITRKDLAPVYYLFGAEEILKDEAVRALTDVALEPHERDFNFDQRGAGGLDPEQLHALVNTLPMMANCRVVVLRDMEVLPRKGPLREVLIRYLGNPSPDTVLILVEAAPTSEEKRREYKPDAEWAGRAYAVECKPLEGERVARWIAHQAKQHGLVFAEGAAEHLGVATGFDLGTIRAELEKFAALPGGEPLTRERVGDLVGIRHGETVEDWVEATLAGDSVVALRLLGQVLEQSGMSGVKMVTQLGTALVGLKLARAHYDKGSRGGALERVLFDRFRQLRPFGIGDWKVVIRNWSRWAEQWPAPRLRSAIRAALAADMALKGTRISDDAGVLTDLVLQLAGQRRAGTATGGAPRRQERAAAGI